MPEPPRPARPAPPSQSAAPAPAIRVLVVDDSPDLTRLYQRMIGLTPGLECVGTLGCADELVTEAARVGAEVVVVDLTMPGRDPLEALKELAAVRPEARAIVFSGHDDPDTVAAAMDAGAWGLVSKNDDPGAVIEAVRRVAAGDVVFPG